MATGRILIVLAAALSGGCILFIHQPIRSGLTASVVGIVGKDDIHEIAGNYFANYHEPFWIKYGKHRGQFLHVRLSTSKDLGLFSDRKHLGIYIRWRFCDNTRQEVHLGIPQVFINGREVDRLHRNFPRQDGTGRFVYNAILRIRDHRSEEERLIGAFDVVAEAFDLEREPRDVCVEFRFPSKLHGYRTRAARIPKRGDSSGTRC